MSNLYEFFQHDFSLLSLDEDLNFIRKNTEGENIMVKSKVLLEHNSSARFFSFYIPESADTVELCKFLLHDLQNIVTRAQGIETIGGMTGDIRIGEHVTFYSNRVYLYIETKLKENELEVLGAIANENKIFITIRDKDYAEQLTAARKPLAFVSHDSRDKELIAKPIAIGLLSRLCGVWYDEYSLNIGDNLRESIEKGIKEVKKCILVITPNFLSNPGWTKKEFDSIFTREMIFEEKIVLPIWHNVSKKDVYDYSPSLANTLALNWPNKVDGEDDQYNRDVQVIISKIHTAIVSPIT